jgi:Ni2+-binding GTPase involved in maturation of urease and hydrogenase
LILVGGFLGAGKTTLLAQAAAQLARRGKRVGLITNDQAANLVDTAVLQHAACEGIEEVSGGCFCCRFDELVSAAEELVRRHRPDVLIGEPVGSCTDLSATVIQPIKKLCAEAFRVAPFSVLVDTRQMRKLQRMRQSLGRAAPSRFPQSVLYIYEKQLEEADLIVLNKTDAVPAHERAELEGILAERFPQVLHLTMSALTGDGVERWLEYVLQDAPAGQRITEVDYDLYAAGEAALGWLNAAVRLRATRTVDAPAFWPAFCLDLVTRIQRELVACPAEIAHLKLWLSTSGGDLVANLTGNDEAPYRRGTIAGTPQEGSLLVNARVRVAPDELEGVVRRCLDAAADGTLEVTVEALESFSPARPRPVHRYDAVI